VGRSSSAKNGSDSTDAATGAAGPPIDAAWRTSEVACSRCTIPQLVNVVKGDMNIVGPRPEQPTIFQELRKELGSYQERQKVLPGITGWAQVNLGYDTSVEDVRKKVELDLEYIGRRSAAKDLAIMARTMPVMVFRRVWM
jgi:lipopolysaccharide/colanic/teichoic acid biosynthesis glycosyltransferase